MWLEGHSWEEPQGTACANVSRGTDLRELEGHQLRSGQQDGTQ